MNKSPRAVAGKTLPSPMGFDRWTELLRGVFTGRKVIVVAEALAGSTATVRAVRELGATEVLAVATVTRGAGEIPAPHEATIYQGSIDAFGPVAMLRAGRTALDHPSSELTAAVESFDPAAEALCVGGFTHEHPTLLGRSFLAYRRPEWLALEDKTTVDALWDRAGVERVASRVAPLDPIPTERNVVWAGDNREGFHGGAEGVRWIRTDADAAAAAVELSERCDSVRVMPFHEGVPCSIHGIVFGDYVAALRPIEMITLRRPADHPQAHHFVYAGCASFYDPPPVRREEMREVARRVGRALRDEVGFRGAFTVDGVMTEDGFRPTELNPRAGAGLNVMRGALGSFPLLLALDAIVAGLDLDWQPVQFEAALVEAADEARGGGTWRMVSAQVDEAKRNLVFHPAPHWEVEDETPDVTVEMGPSASGAFLRSMVAPGRFASGPSFAPTAAAIWEFLDRDLGLDFGPILPCHPSEDAVARR